MLSGLKGITRSFRPSPPLGRGSREGGPGHRAGAGGRGECGAAPRGPVWYLEISSIWFVCPSASSLSICEVTVSPCQGHVPSGLKLDGRNREELFVGIGCTGDPGHPEPRSGPRGAREKSRRWEAGLPRCLLLELLSRDLLWARCSWAIAEHHLPSLSSSLCFLPGKILPGPQRQRCHVLTSLYRKRTYKLLPRSKRQRESAGE